MTDTQSAYLEWKEAQRTLMQGGYCCYRDHYYLKSVRAIAWNPIADEKVCLRERTWRRYVRQRDGNHNFMMVPYSENQ